MSESTESHLLHKICTLVTKPGLLPFGTKSQDLTGGMLLEDPHSFTLPGSSPSRIQGALEPNVSSAPNDLSYLSVNLVLFSGNLNFLVHSF